MDYKPLPVGVDNFEKLVTRGYYFIDKTWYMKELLDRKGDVNLFTRPRRFGKTLNMSMLQYFFEDMRTDDGEKQDNAYLFENMKIMQAGEQYLAHMGKYPVINLTLKDAKQPNFELAYEAIKWQIADEYARYAYILNDEKFSDEKEAYLKIKRRTADRSAYNNSIKFLSQCLEKYYGRKVIILIDEYDVPLENAFTEKFYEEMIGFIRSLFESAFKTNGSLEFAVITGCLRISKESIFTGLNNLEVISILDWNYGEYFGFVKPVSRRKEAFIVGFKTTKKMKALDAKAEEALEQIKDKKYALELEEDGYDYYNSYGISFCGKDCCVKLREEITQ
jgi:Predicted AAA-ATPase.